MDVVEPERFKIFTVLTKALLFFFQIDRSYNQIA